MTIAGEAIDGRMVALAAALLMPHIARAENYPNRPVRLILPFGPGGVADVTARIVTEKLGEKLGQRFIIENMPGAGGINAARAVLSSPADGYTLALLSNGTAISVSLFRNLNFDPLTDFVPVSSIGTFDFIFVTKAGSPYRTLADFINAAKKSPARSMSAPSMSARRRTSRRNCSNRPPASTSPSFHSAVRRRC